MGIRVPEYCCVAGGGNFGVTGKGGCVAYNISGGERLERTKKLYLSTKGTVGVWGGGGESATFHWLFLEAMERGEGAGQCMGPLPSRLDKQHKIFN